MRFDLSENLVKIAKHETKDNSTADVYNNEYIGNREASNASAYEANK